VLLNARHHFYERYGKRPPEVRLDPASSAGAFDGWRRSSMIRVGAISGSRTPPGIRDLEIAPTAKPGTWLLRTGWRRHRLIDPAEVPGSAGRS
jgi:hypothetical protein